jgi:hypothetical protein
VRGALILVTVRVLERDRGAELLWDRHMCQLIPDDVDAKTLLAVSKAPSPSLVARRVPCTFLSERIVRGSWARVAPCARDGSPRVSTLIGELAS